MADANEEAVRKTLRIISQVFSLPGVVIPSSSDWDENQLLRQLQRELTIRCEELLNHNLERLLFLLYQIDINEKKARQLFEQELPQKIPKVLADYIIQRQLDKLRTRNKNSKA